MNDRGWGWVDNTRVETRCSNATSIQEWSKSRNTFLSPDQNKKTTKNSTLNTGSSEDDLSQDFYSPQPCPPPQKKTPCVVERRRAKPPPFPLEAHFFHHLYHNIKSICQEID